MQNFSTNQFRNLYVAKALKTGTAAVADAGDIKLVATKNNEDIMFQYVNGDGLITHTDIIKVANITDVNHATANSLVTPLMKKTVTLNTGVTLANLKGKHVSLTLNLREFIGLDYSENYPITVTVYVDTTTASTFWTALKTELENALLPFGSKVPVTVSGGTSNLEITEKAQKWVRGKLAATPIHFELEASLVADASNPMEYVAWATISDPVKNGEISGDFKLADLEYFTMGERGDFIRTYAYPNDYNPTYLINPVAGTKTYDVITIEFYYQGSAEDVQKSPKTIQIAAPSSVATSIKSAIDAIVNPAPAA